MSQEGADTLRILQFLELAYSEQQVQVNALKNTEITFLRMMPRVPTTS